MQLLSAYDSSPDTTTPRRRRIRPCPELNIKVQHRFEGLKTEDREHQCAISVQNLEHHLNGVKFVKTLFSEGKKWCARRDSNSRPSGS
jgi:hypothetical protein